jgi:hypothetical protein
LAFKLTKPHLNPFNYHQHTATHIYIIESVSPLEIVKHPRLIQIRQLGHVVHSNVVLLIRISRKKLVRKSQNLKKPLKKESRKISTNFPVPYKNHFPLKRTKCRPSSPKCSRLGFACQRSRGLQLRPRPNLCPRPKPWSPCGDSSSVPEKQKRVKNQKQKP